jgi:Flp pilus assembly pilin Flp
MRHPWFDRNRKGQALMEYILLIALVATCLVAILGLTRKAANDAYTRTAVQLGPMRHAGLGGSSGSGSSWHGGGGSGKPTPADADSAGGSADAGDPPSSDVPVSAFSSGAR